MKLTNEWTLVKNDRLRDIKTYARLEDGKRYRSFKATVLMKEVKPETLVRLILDFDNYNKWYWQVLESKLLKKVSPTEYYLYLVHKAPTGLPDRDVILHATVQPQTATRNYLLLKVDTEPNYIPPKPPLVRMIAEDLSFKFTPVNGNDIFVEAEGYVDPGGQVPSWAANFIQHSAPYSVALGVLRMLKKDEYVKSREPVPFKVYSYNDYMEKQRLGQLPQAQ
ncbi:hypothetical protein [Agitococcus lubricus]|nr:hypothetical protein [Agitococcus lubricus]